MSDIAKLLPVSRLKYLTKINSVTIDNLVFRLHYRLTFTSLLVCSILITIEQFFGKPIKCIINGDVPVKLLDTYCWFAGTFTVPKALLKGIGTEVVAPGVENSYDNEITVHAYYQWVFLVMFLQGICFYLTRILWKGWENGKMKALIDGLNVVIMKEKEKNSKKDDLVRYLTKNRGQHNAYAFRYFICEVLNFLNVIIQIIFVNYFLGGEFYKYGLDVMRFSDTDPHQIDPMAKIFPKLSKCSFHRFGPSGEITRFDHLCLIPFNIFNEKIYLIIWFWFYFLLIVSGLTVLYRLTIIVFPQNRYIILHRMHYLVPARCLETILCRCAYGDLFVLFLLGKNLDTMYFRDIIIQLSVNLDSIVNNEAEDEFDESKTNV